MDEKNITVLFMVYEEGMAPWRGGGGSGGGLPDPFKIEQAL